MEATLPEGLAVMSESFSRRRSGTDEYEFVLDDGGEVEESLRSATSVVRRGLSGQVRRLSLMGLLACLGVFSGLLKRLLLSGLSPSSSTERFLLSGLAGGRLYASMLMDLRYLLAPKSQSSPSGLTDLVTLREL